MTGMTSGRGSRIVHISVGKQAAFRKAGRGLLLGGLAVGLALALGARVAQAKVNVADAIPLPVKSRGPLLFYMDLASFPAGAAPAGAGPARGAPADAAPARTEIYLRVPGDELVYSDTVKAGSPEGSARLHVRIRVRDGRGKPVVNEERDVEVPVAERDAKGFSLG